MAPTVLFALFAMMLAGGDQTTGGDAPVATQVKPPAPQQQPQQPPQSPPPMAPPGMGNFSALNPATAPPADDYGYVAWCYGALSGYLALYEQAMPEVTRIEKEFPGPDGVEEDLKVYPQLRAQARADLKLYAVAIDAAEKASPKPIAPYGAAAAKRGMAVWNGARRAPKAKLAQMWMSWSPPEKCEVTAVRLKSKASVLGQALAANTPDVSTLETPDQPAPTQVKTAVGALAFDPLPTPAASPAMAPPAPVATPKAPVAMAPTPAPAMPEPLPPAPAAELATAVPEAPAPTAAPATPTPAAPVAMAETPPAPPVAMPPPVTTPAGPPEPDPGLWYRGVP
jgi:hypothetical protein